MTHEPEDPRLERLRRLLSRDLDQEATPEQRQELETGFDEHPELVETEIAYRTVRDQVQTLPDQVADDLLTRLRNVRLETRAMHRVLVGTTAAALLVAIGLTTAASLDGGPAHRPSRDAVSTTDAEQTRLVTRMALLRGPFANEVR